MKLPVLLFVGLCMTGSAMAQPPLPRQDGDVGGVAFVAAAAMCDFAKTDSHLVLQLHSTLQVGVTALLSTRAGQ